MRGSWLVLQHVPFEGPGAWTSALAHHGYGIHTLHAGDELPDSDRLDAYAGVLTMGGPMHALDDVAQPWLQGERRLLAAAARRGIPVIGVCLGAQLLAAGLGAGLTRAGHVEYGMGTVRLTAAGRRHPGLKEAAVTGVVPVVHWHEDGVGLPSGAQLLARTEVTPVQAFVWRRALGLQFHIELTPADADRLTPHLPEGMTLDRGALAAAQERWSILRLGLLADLLHP